MKDFLYKGACSFLFAGYLPKFPGTWASAAALIPAAVALALGADLYLAAPVAALGASVIAIPLGNRAESAFGRKDPGHFVLDEVAGLYVSLSFLCRYDAFVLVAAFAAFRFFDIFKPWPIRKLEKLPGGFGILMDDLAAGAAANLVLRFLILLSARAGFP